MTNYTKKDIDKAGTVRYYNDKDQLHRLDGPAVEYASGGKEWWVDGQLHRLDGPAFEGSDGSKSWWVDGKLHRLDGPAVEDADGDKFWWVDGNPLTEDEFNKHPLVVEAKMVRLIGEVLGG